ncbi:MAG TPA: DUF4118 domain-containing protein [Bryobacteraceae bacterium]|jgi:K+-sensing histidine kinase KdpD
MELAAVRNETWKGGAIGIGACILTLAVGGRLQAVTGDAGVLLGLFVATAVAAWYAGRWAGIVTTAIGVFANAYILPPAYSLAIAKPADWGAVSSFAVGGIIVSLLCGAAWQLRLETRAMEATQTELLQLRARNAELSDQVRRQEAALAASDQFFAAASRTAATEAASETAGPYTRQQGIRRMLEILLCRAHEDALRSVHFDANRLPDSWHFTAAFHPEHESPPAEPLTPLEVRMCNRIVTREGGRCWTSRSNRGAWELKFTLPRV